jgi:beta,beta-carotene 9',10'-dioxygenase
VPLQARRPTSWHWSLARTSDSTANSLVKLHVHTGESRLWADRDAYPSQPICVADFTGSGEDGVLLSVDAAGESSYPLVLDAETIHERARARVPHHLPFAIQGEF